MKDLRARTLRGGLAKICAQGATLALRLGSLMILARLLYPAEFGLVAMVTVLTGALGLFRDFGLSAATVQRAIVSDAQVSNLFWINLLGGALLASVAVAGATLVAAFYHEPRLYWITNALAATFLITAIGVQHSARLQREMRFVALAAVDVASVLASVTAGVVAALQGAGYWALVIMTLVAPLAYSILVWLVSGWIPKRPGQWHGVGSMMRFGGVVTLNGVVVYVAYNIEKVLLGRFWGADALGLYGRAYQLVSLPIDNLNSSLGDVAFAALSRVQEDAGRLRSFFLKGYSLVLACTSPIALACFVFADDLIAVVLGPKWSEAGPIFRLLAPTILVFAMINPMWWLLASKGLVNRSLKIGLVLAPLVIAGYVVGLPYGPRGVALAYSTIMILWVVPHIVWCTRGTGVSLRDVLSAASRPLLSAVVAAALASGAIALLGASLSPLGRLAIGVLLLVLAFVGMLLFALGQKQVYLDLVRNLSLRPPR